MIGAIKKWWQPSSVDTLQGGIALKRNKPGLPQNGIIQTLETPTTLRIPLLNYQRETLEPTVSIGQDVKVSEVIAPGVIASVSGKVIEISPHVIAHPSNSFVPCVVIAPHHEERISNLKSFEEQPVITLERIKDCGIHGLGGAGFNTADKLAAPLATEEHIDTLIINAVECEPLISCDESLLITDSEHIVDAIQNLVEFTKCKRCIVAIEDDKRQALEAFKNAMSHLGESTNFELKLLPPVYPAGAERPLIERLTQQPIPANKVPSDLGIVCINVSTAYAIEQARQGLPMISRIVTIAGDLATNPVNVRVRFGTSVLEVLRQTKNDNELDDAIVRIGGPLSGFLINDLSVPITATTNSIIVESKRPQSDQLACIRCSACSDVCPVSLHPQQLYQLTANENIKHAESFRVTSCIECGCCDLVCPSNIPLTQSFRFLKGRVKEQHRQENLAHVAELRFQHREQRQLERSELRAKKREAAKQRLTTEDAPLSDALERAKQRRKRKSAKKPIKKDDINSAKPGDASDAGES